MKRIFWLLCIMMLPSAVIGSTDVSMNIHSLDDYTSYLALLVFFIAYGFVMTEELTHLRKSKPVVIAAGLIWMIVALIAKNKGLSDTANLAVKHYLLEYAELFMFLLVAMTYVNAMEDRLIFDALKTWLLKRGYTYKQLFYATGLIAFFLSPIADNLTTALLMCAVIMALGKGNKSFVAVSCVNIVVAANAGGAYSPFGDITTLMVWQSGKLHFIDFFAIFIPSLLSFIIPQALMAIAIPKTSPQKLTEEIKILDGAYLLVFLFIATIITAISFHQFLHLPPVIGMMTGLGYLNFFSYYYRHKEKQRRRKIDSTDIAVLAESEALHAPFDIFNKIKRAEWDTLFFFYGVILCVGGLACIGFLESSASTLYQSLGAALPAKYQALPANIIVGILSAVFDNIPVTYAVLTMNPAMSQGHWLLVTLTAGIGGSLLSIGSAAGVALMGQAKGHYTFLSHLKWSPAIILGFIVGVLSHLLLNNHLF